MVISEEIRFIASTLLCNEKGYVSEDELSLEYPNWRDHLEEMEEAFLDLGIIVHSFEYKGQRCLTLVSLLNDSDIRLSERESYLLIDFIIRFQLFEPNENGLDKKKWREVISSKIGGKKIRFNETFIKLRNKGFLEERNYFIIPGWRYYVALDIKSILEEIKRDAKLAMLINGDKEERGIID